MKLGINYGWNKVRFPAAVPAGTRVRARAEVALGRGARRRLVARRHQVHRRGRGSGQARLRRRERRPRPDRLNRSRPLLDGQRALHAGLPRGRRRCRRRCRCRASGRSGRGRLASGDHCRCSRAPCRSSPRRRRRARARSRVVEVDRHLAGLRRQRGLCRRRAAARVGREADRRARATATATAAAAVAAAGSGRASACWCCCCCFRRTRPGRATRRRRAPTVSTSFLIDGPPFLGRLVSRECIRGRSSRGFTASAPGETSASRPSKKAVTPSRRSSVAMLSAIPWRSSCRWSVRVFSMLCADQQLRHPHVVGRLGGQLLGLLAGARPSARRPGTTSVTMPVSQRLLGAQVGVVEQQLERPAGPDHARQEVGHAAVGRGADPPVGARRRPRPRRRSGCRTRAPARSRRRPPAPLTARDHRIGDAAEVDDRLVQHLGAAPHLGGQVDAGLLDARA